MLFSLKKDRISSSYLASRIFFQLNIIGKQNRASNWLTEETIESMSIMRIIVKYKLYIRYYIKIKCNILYYTSQDFQEAVPVVWHVCLFESGVEFLQYIQCSAHFSDRSFFSLKVVIVKRCKFSEEKGLNVYRLI